MTERDWSVCDECKAGRHSRCRMPISKGVCCCADTKLADEMDEQDRGSMSSSGEGRS